MFSVLQVLGGPWAFLLPPEGESKKCFPSFLFVCFLYFPFYPPVTMISIQRTTGLSGCCVSNQNPHSPTLCSTSSARKIMLGYCWTKSLPFLPLPSLLLSFPLLCHSWSIHTLLGAQISGSPSCIDICQRHFLLLFMDVWLVTNE